MSPRVIGADNPRRPDTKDVFCTDPVIFNAERKNVGELHSNK